MKYGFALPKLNRYDVHVLQDPAIGKPLPLPLTAATADCIYGIGQVKMLR